MDVDDLITDLGAAGVTLWLEDDELRFRAPKGVFTEDRRSAVREHRAAIVDRLRRGDDVRIAADRAGRHDPFPLTDLQAAYLVGRGSHYEYGGIACHAYVEYDYADLDPRRVQSTWDRLVARHDMLRAVVHPDGYQVVLPEPPAYLVPVTDLRGQDDATVDEHLRSVRAGMSHRVAQTDRWPLFALHLTRTDDRAVLHLSLDLLIVDYASVQLLMSEFDRLYQEPAALPEPPEIGFRDYVIGRRRVTETAAYARDRDYWLGRLDDLPPAPDLPVTGSGDGTAPVRFRRLEHVLDAGAWADLRDRAARHRSTASAALLTAYAEVIGRWSRTPRFTLVVPTFQRLPLHPDVERLVGDFTVVEPLAVDLGEPLPFDRRVARLSERLLEDLSHGLFTGSEVLGELARRTGTRPLLPVVFTSTVDAPAHDSAGPARGAVGYAISQTPQVWIDCQVMPRGDGLALSWDVRDGVLPPGFAEDAFTAWVDLVTRLAGGDDTWAESGPVRLPAAQVERRRRVNDTGGPLPDGLLHQDVIAQARRTPDRIAVVAGGVRLTYGELLGRSAAVADHLRTTGLRPAEPVAVVMDKGWEQVVAVLGVLLAGGAYLPVETTQPAARRDAILADAGVRTALTQSWLSDGIRWPRDVRQFAVDLLAPAAAPDVSPRSRPDDLAYVIYTSGSTGSPKGVMISHRAARNTVDDINRRFTVGSDDAVLGLAGLGFDLSVYDIFGPLAVGGRLVLPDADRRGDPSHWADLVDRHAVTVWNSVPGQLQMLHHYLRGTPTLRLDTLRLAMLSGDWIPVTLPDDIRALVPALRVVSLGGATEGAIWSIWHPVEEVDLTRPSIPYGTPLTNQRFHVLDDRLRDRPDWTAGELYIGGAGVALGYYHDPERTAERFLTHPVTGERLYRTGDLGRYWPDGTIEFLGREDDQVKIRGYRIELAEVESAVQTHPGVAHTAVLVDADHQGGKRLAAFVEPAVTEPDPAAAGEAGQVAAVAAAVSRAAQSGVDPAALRAFQDALSDVAYAVMSRTLHDAGLFTDGRSHGADEVATTLSATATTRPIVRRWLAALATAGHLTADPETGGYRGPLRLAVDGLEAPWQRLAEAERRVAYSTDLIEAVRTCSGRLPELISGSVDVRALLFPGARADTMAAAYRDNLAVAHLNEAAAAVLRGLAGRHTGDGPLRVVEVGGGVAGTTSVVAPALAEFAPDYLFTDPSAFFLAEARERFAHHPWIRYARLDLRDDPRAQGLAPNTADIVICPNHLHTAPDAAAALERLRSLLAPGGWLLLMEQTRDDDPALLVSMEFLEAAAGPFTDARAAGGQSFLTETQWRNLLGNDLVATLPAAGEPLHATGQQLFLARVKTDRAVLTPAGLARHTGTRVPEYMVPSVWQVVDALPATGNGKVDRKRLRSWLPAAGAGERTAAVANEPADALERQIAAIWAELLDRDHVGRHDDFFDLGGDSLLVARLVGLLRERVPDVVALEWEVVLRHMLRRPTVAALAAYLRGATASGVADADSRSDGAVRTSPLVRLHGSGADPVTVLVHAGTGTIMPYRALVTEIRRRSAGTGAVVGLEVPHLPDYLDAEPEGLIERISADYVRSLLELGSRELHLVGYCLGGLIATEVARGLSEAGSPVATLTAISSHSPRFRLEDELLSEYSFSVMMGIAPADLGFPADELAVARAGDAVLAASPGVMRDGGFAALTGEHAGVAAAFRALAELPREQRVARMCEAVPASAGMYEPDHMMRLFRTFRQSVFAITRYEPEPYAGDITFLRHSGAYPFPGSRDAVTQHWSELCLGDLRIIDVPGDHFSCVDVAHAPGLVKLLSEITGGAVTR